MRAIEHDSEVTIQILQHVQAQVRDHLQDDAAKDAARQVDQSQT